MNWRLASLMLAGALWGCGGASDSYDSGPSGDGDATTPAEDGGETGGETGDETGDATKLPEVRYYAIADV